MQMHLGDLSDRFAVRLQDVATALFDAELQPIGTDDDGNALFDVIRAKGIILAYCRDAVMARTQLVTVAKFAEQTGIIKDLVFVAAATAHPLGVTSKGADVFSYEALFHACAARGHWPQMNCIPSENSKITTA